MVVQCKFYACFTWYESFAIMTELKSKLGLSVFFLSTFSIGSVLAYNDIRKYNLESEFSILIFLLCALVAICVHGAGNLVNTYYDYKNGIDLKTTCNDRTLVDKILKPEDITRLGVILYTLGSMGFMILLHLSPNEFLLAIIYFGGLSLSFMYTGGIGLKYMALGDLIIIITFGPITVLFAYISQIGIVNYTDIAKVYLNLLRPLVYSIPLTMHTECILHSNNSRDIETDKRAGVVTIAMILGFTGSYLLYIFLLFVPYIVLVAMSIKLSVFYLVPLATMPLAFSLEKEFRFKDMQLLPLKTAKLNLVFGLLYVFSCFYSSLNK
jgi:1,4-dihydroxy-2-naphthoate octaprenyltransferase